MLAVRIGDKYQIRLTRSKSPRVPDRCCVLHSNRFLVKHSDQSRHKISAGPHCAIYFGTACTLSLYLMLDIMRLQGLRLAKIEILSVQSFMLANVGIVSLQGLMPENADIVS